MIIVLRIIVSILALMVSCIMFYRLMNIWFLSTEYIYCVLRDIANLLGLDQEENNSGVFYETPLVAFVYTTIALVSVNSILFHNNFFVCFVVTDTILSLLYYIGMYCKFHDHSQDYKRVVEANLSFSKLCYTPILFLITVYGFLLAATGVHISEWSAFVQQYVNMYSRCEHFIINCMENSFFRLVASYGYGSYQSCARICSEIT